MSTHGRILFKNDPALSSDKLNVYAWSNGQKTIAINDLLSMPHTIFKLAKLHAENNLIPGHWFYRSFMQYANKEKYNKQSLYELWQILLPVEIHLAGIVNWFTSLHFDRWTVVPNLKYCTYPGNPDLIVELCTFGEGLETNYCIIIDNEEAPGFNLKTELDDLVSNLNGLIRPGEQVWGNPKIVPINDNMANQFGYMVPIEQILFELMWQEIEDFYQANQHE